MADIRINDLPLDTSPVDADMIAVDGATTRRVTIQKLADTGIPAASQAEAEAGVNSYKRMTPLTTAQAIDAIGVIPGDLATVATSGAYNDLSGKPTLGTAAAQNTTAFATAAQGVKADSAIQPTPLADDTGSALVGFKQADTGAVSKTIAAILARRVSVLDFGPETMGQGIVDCKAYIQAAIAAVTARGGGFVYVPSGVYLISAYLDIPDYVYLYGDGDGASEIQATGDFAILSSVRTSGTVQNGGGARDLTLRGFGKANANAHGVKIAWVNRTQFRNLRFFACRNAFDFSNVWQVQADYLSVDGAGADQNYNGFYGHEVDPSNQNNAVIASNCIVQNVSNVGYRLINFNGSKFSNCESAGSGSHGWHLGAPGSGTEQIRWGHFVNILADTATGDLFRIEKGSSTAVNLFQIANLWLGNGDAYGLNVIDCSLINFANVMAVSMKQAAVHFLRSSRCVLNGAVINDFDSDANGDAGILIENSDGNIITGNQIYTTIGTGPAIKELGTSAGNIITENNIGNSGMTILSSTSIVKGNVGYKTHAQGTQDLLAATTSTVVTHGLARTPDNGDIMITPRFNPLAFYWVDTITSTQFTIRVASAPGGNIAFSWQADVSRG